MAGSRQTHGHDRRDRRQNRLSRRGFLNAKGTRSHRVGGRDFIIASRRIGQSTVDVTGRGLIGGKGRLRTTGCRADIDRIGRNPHGGSRRPTKGNIAQTGGCGDHWHIRRSGAAIYGHCVSTGDRPHGTDRVIVGRGVDGRRVCVGQRRHGTAQGRPPRQRSIGIGVGGAAQHLIGNRCSGITATGGPPRQNELAASRGDSQGRWHSQRVIDQGTGRRRSHAAAGGIVGHQFIVISIAADQTRMGVSRRGPGVDIRVGPSDRCRKGRRISGRPRERRPRQGSRKGGWTCRKSGRRCRIICGSGASHGARGLADVNITRLVFDFEPEVVRG